MQFFRGHAAACLLVLWFDNCSNVKPIWRGEGTTDKDIFLNRRRNYIWSSLIIYICPIYTFIIFDMYIGMCTLYTHVSSVYIYIYYIHIQNHTSTHASVCVSQRCSVNVWVLSKRIVCHLSAKSKLPYMGLQALDKSTFLDQIQCVMGWLEFTCWPWLVKFKLLGIKNEI